MKKITRDKLQTIFAKEIEPVIEIEPGETLLVETEDALFHTVRTEKDLYKNFTEIWNTLKGNNPVTGPIYIKGAQPGDNIAVKIEKMECFDPWTNTIQGLGGLSDFLDIKPDLPATATICSIEDGMVIYPTSKGDLKIPIAPMIGTIGVAPLVDRYRSHYHSPEHLGNVDVTDICPGNTVIMPVNFEGALLALGDCHAAQGDGELCGTALECRADVTITVDLIKKKDAKYMECPQIEYPDAIGSIGCIFMSSMDDIIRAAYRDILRRMEKYYGFDLIEAYKLITQVGEIVIGQIVPPLCTCVAKIKKEYLL